jgi:branched-chain amino acid transport system substrate-binding protein
MGEATMSIPKLILSFLISMGVLWLVGCEKETPKADQARVIKIGVIYPFTGPNASTGKDLKAGVELAIEIVNHSMDLPIPLAKEKGLPGHGGAMIEVIYRDSQSDPDKSADWVERLVKEDRVCAIMGCYSSTVTAGASERAETLKVPFINAASTSPMLTRRGFKWFFRTTPSDHVFAENFFTFLSDLERQLKMEVPKRLILVYENQLWGTSVAQAERRLALMKDYAIADEIPYDAKQNSFHADLERIRKSPESIIFHTSYEQDAVLFMKGYKQLQINPIAILAMNAGFISPYFLDSLGPDGNFVLSREVWAIDLGAKKPLVIAVNDLFKKRFQRNMTGNSARAFTGVYVLAEAMNRAKSFDPLAIREALLATDLREKDLIMPWDGVSFDKETGQNILGRGIIVQVQNGEYVTVWPWRLAARNVIWPMPPWSKRGADK